MAIKILPLIEREDYEEFVRLLPAMSTTFDQWSFKHEQRKAEYARARIDVRAVLVRPAGFVNFRDKTNTPRTLSALETYAQRTKTQGASRSRRVKIDVLSSTAQPTSWPNSTASRMHC